MPKFQSSDKFRRPELFFAELIKQSVAGTIVDTSDNARVMHRATVLAVDVIGGKLENRDGAGGVTHNIDGKETNFPANIGPENPPGSIKARVLTEGFDQFSNDGDVRVFWPFFPEHQRVPIKPGEHVYVLFEDRDFLHGLWISKVAGHEDLNYYRGQTSYEPASKRSLPTLFNEPAASAPEDALNTDGAAGESKISGDRLTKLF